MSEQFPMPSFEGLKHPEHQEEVEQSVEPTQTAIEAETEDPFVSRLNAEVEVLKKEVGDLGAELQELGCRYDVITYEDSPAGGKPGLRREFERIKFEIEPQLLERLKAALFTDTAVQSDYGAAWEAASTFARLAEFETKHLRYVDNLSGYLEVTTRRLDDPLPDFIDSYPDSIADIPEVLVKDRLAEISSRLIRALRCMKEVRLLADDREVAGVDGELARRSVLDKIATFNQELITRLWEGNPPAVDEDISPVLECRNIAELASSSGAYKERTSRSWGASYDGELFLNAEDGKVWLSGSYYEAPDTARGRKGENRDWSRPPVELSDLQF